MAEPPLYDVIGRSYTATRAADPRIADALWRALGDARSVLNVGAGAGAYEPPDRKVLALEPSAVMIAQRAPDAAPVVQASAEALPLGDGSVDAAMAVLSDHHWRDRPRALRELRRVARRRVVLFTADPAQVERFWLTREYLPGFVRLVPQRHREPGVWAGDFEAELGSVHLQRVPIPHDCLDGFYGAFWRRPDAYLRPVIRGGISVFARLPEPEVVEGLLDCATTSQAVSGTIVTSNCSTSRCSTSAIASSSLTLRSWGASSARWKLYKSKRPLSGFVGAGGKLI